MEPSHNGFLSSGAVRTVGVIFLAIASLFLLAKTISAFRGDEGLSQDAKPKISVTGTGDFVAKPDIATLTYNILEDGKTPTEAQEKATKRWNDALAYLKSAGIEEKDVKTVNYSLNPKYEYQQLLQLQNLPTGENKVTSNVTITYEIR
jgi:uncharacterized protein YggE